MDLVKTLQQQEPKPAASSEQPEIHDRILDAYFGKMGDQFMLDTQKRIHWVCGKVKGPRVLDVGCSQGIAPVLLGREGCQVTGIDSDPQSIAAAEAFLASQPAGVQKNVKFLNADFVSHPFNGELFDSVILSEVLEHLVNPASFVALAAERLEAGGRLVVTVPFGINDFIDHKHTYYLLAPYRLLSRHFEVVEVVILGKWLGLVGRRRAAGEKVPSVEFLDAELVERLEASFLDLERELRKEAVAVRALLNDANQKYRTATEQINTFKKEITHLSSDVQEKGSAVQEAERQLNRQKTESEAFRSRLEEANQKYRTSTEQITTFKERLAQQEATRKAAEDSLAQLQKQFEVVQGDQSGERTTFKQELARLTAEIQEKGTAVHEAEKQMIRQQAESEAFRSRLEDANQKYRTSTEQISTLKERLAQQEATRKAAEDSLAQLQKQFEVVQGDLVGERTTFKQELTRLTAEVQEKGTAVHEAEKLLIRQQSESEAFRSRLEDANQKYRTSTEQISTLKERLAQQEATRKSAEDSLAQLQKQLEVVQGDLAEERTTFKQELARLTAEIQEKNTATHVAENQLMLQLDELETLRARLDDASLKYRTATEQVSAFKEQLAQQVADRVTAEENSEILETKLRDANLKYRWATSDEIPKLKEKLESQYVKVREQSHTVEQLRIALQTTTKKLSGVNQKVEKLQHQKLMAEQQVVRTRDTLSFRLGYLLMHCFKSFDGVIGLPKALWSLRQETVARREKRDNKKTFDPIIPVRPQIDSSATVEIISSSVALPNLSVDTAQEIKTVVGKSPNFVINADLAKLKTACIMDEFTYGSYAPECVLQQLTPDNWEAELNAFKPELLFIESAWRGKDDLWGNKVGHSSKELQGVVGWCRERNIPTLFWNKEDPVHFETFLTTARLFDYVFTTDFDCIHRYKGALGHERVYLLPFACQPAVNNPIEVYERKDAFCFAGAYYVRYPERTRDLESFVADLPTFRPLEIFDRNFGKNDLNYQFPPAYQPYIVGTLPFDQIDKAYKGYRYAINLNSIKQSQTMFARRVYDLLGCNTITVSNFSRGLRLLFGDLVITTDNGDEAVRRLNALADDETHARKLRLAALRKVMLEHTYGQRLAYVASKISGQAIAVEMPQIAVMGYATTQAEMLTLLGHFQRQEYKHAILYLVLGSGVEADASLLLDMRVRTITADEAARQSIGQQIGGAKLVAALVADDYYGVNYLQDMALATLYSKAALIGKSAHYSFSDAVRLEQKDSAYRPVGALPARCAAICADVVSAEPLLTWVTALPELELSAQDGLAIDEFNYCRNGSSADLVTVAAEVDDLTDINTGISIHELLARAEQIAPELKADDECATLTGKELSGDFSKAPSGAIQLDIEGNNWRVASTLDDAKHEYLYATSEHTLEALNVTEEFKFYLDVTPGLNIQLVVVFLDAQKQKISHVIKHPNRNQEADIPTGTALIRFGLRFYASGSAEIKGLVLGHRPLRPSEVLDRAEHLILTNHYPSYDDLYRNGFVHSRVAAYAERGVRVDVFRLRKDEDLSYHEFHNVDVITGSQEALHKLLTGGHYKSVLVHFLDEAMWQVLQHHIERIKVFVWVHGAEIQPWHRRDNFENEQQRDAAKVQSEARMMFWTSLLKQMPENLKLIFVSNYLAEVTMEDLGFRLPELQYTVIHNAIDTNLFAYHEKSTEQRKKVLSIRPYASRTYANDLSVRAILELSNKAYFNQIEFRLIGDGRLFDEVLAPIRGFSNVYIEQRFMTRAEIAALHREYGIFLCPSRMDTQGVSRDEAMSSGLVPVTNLVAAIPEFVDETCGFLADGEDAEGIANGIAELFESPEKFLAMSMAAGERVRRQSSSQQIISRELSLFSS